MFFCETAVPVETTPILLLYGHYILEIGHPKFSKTFFWEEAQVVAEEVAHLLP
jgi:hypothetical protein